MLAHNLESSPGEIWNWPQYMEDKERPKSQTTPDW